MSGLKTVLVSETTAQLHVPITDGRKVTQIWNNGVAEYRWQVTEYQPHFWHQGQAAKIWDEMFSKYQRAANGQLVKLP